MMPVIYEAREWFFFSQFPCQTASENKSGACGWESGRAGENSIWLRCKSSRYQRMRELAKATMSLLCDWAAPPGQLKPPLWRAQGADLIQWMTTCFAVRSSNTLITFNLPDLSQSLAATLIRTTRRTLRNSNSLCMCVYGWRESQEREPAATCALRPMSGEQVALTVKLIQLELAPMIGTIEWGMDANYGVLFQAAASLGY